MLNLHALNFLTLYTYIFMYIHICASLSKSLASATGLMTILSLFSFHVTQITPIESESFTIYNLITF